MDRPALKKSLGQHHLRQSALCRPLLDFLAPEGRLVVEIGPGGGVLTEALLEAGARVLAWELDVSWAFRAARSVGGGPRARFVVGDALELPWEKLPDGVLVAGNLPYNVATPLIDRMLGRSRRLERAGVLVQREVAERLAASPGGKAYGALSVLTQARASVRILGRVRPGSFEPPPKVESAFVGLVPLAETPPRERFEALTTLVHTAFGQRRKTLANALSRRWPKERVAAALSELGLRGDVRAEQVSLAGFETLLKRLGSV